MKLITAKQLQSLCSRDPARPELLTPYTLTGHPETVYASDGTAMVALPVGMVSGGNFSENSATWGTLEIIDSAKHQQADHVVPVPALADMRTLAADSKSPEFRNRLRVACATSYHPVVISVSPGGEFKFCTKGDYVGELVAALNPGYLVALRAMGFDALEIRSNIVDPVVVRSSVRPGAIAVVMPMCVRL